MKLTGIYALADPRTGVVRYVGQSIDILRRFKYHQRRVVWATVDVWMRELRYSGISTRLIILELCSRASLDDRERWWVAAYARSVGLLNHTAGGGGCLDPSPQTRWRMGTATRGKRLSPETRAKLSAAHKGRPKSPEARAKMSAAARRRTADQNAECAA